MFLEVKTRATADFGEPDRAVDAEKRDHIERAAQEYRRCAPVPPEVSRFEMISIVLEMRCG